MEMNELTCTATDEEPDGVLLLLVHGGLANATVWREQLRLFANELPCLAPDLPGHGLRRQETPGTAADIADDLAASFSGPCVVVGHSVGGLLCMST
jgi:pimeloyl-ACP methyl ester carboxylesterase